MTSQGARSGLRLPCRWLPLLLTTYLRAIWLVRFPTDPLGSIDAEGFHLLASNLLDGNGFAIGWEAPFCPTAIRTPLYPLFVAAIYAVWGRIPQMVVLCQILLETLTSALVMALAARLVPRHQRGDRFWSLLPGVIYALNGTTQRFTASLLSEALLLPLLNAALIMTVCLLRNSRPSLAAGTGLVWGLVLLTKPNAQYLALIAAGLIVVRVIFYPRAMFPLVRRVATVSAYCGVLAITLVAWVLRNHQQFDRWLLSSAFEENLARVSAVVVQAALSGVKVEPWTPTWEHIYEEFVVAVDPAAVVILQPVGSVPCPVLDHYHRKVGEAARKLVAEHAVIYAGIHLQSSLRSIMDPGHRVWYRILTERDWAETGVLPALGPRIRWALERGAWGDALAAFWRERVVRIPLGAGLLWWGLVAGRVAVVLLTARGILRQRSELATVLLLAGVLLYHLFLPGPIAHDRFYVPVVPIVTALVACGAGGYNKVQSLHRRVLGGGPDD